MLKIKLVECFHYLKATPGAILFYLFLSKISLASSEHGWFFMFVLYWPKSLNLFFSSSKNRNDPFTGTMWDGRTNADVEVDRLCPEAIDALLLWFGNPLPN